MAKKKPNLSLAKAASGNLADLIGNSMSITLPNGGTVLVPADRLGNKIANAVVAANVRQVLEEAIKRYRDKEMLPTPKDLRDLAEAAAALARFSGDIYKEDDPIPTTPPKQADSAPASSDDISFDETPAPKPENKA